MSAMSTRTLRCTSQATEHKQVPAAANPRQRRLAKNKRNHKEGLEWRQQVLEEPVATLRPPPPPPVGPGLSLSCPHFEVCSGCTLDTNLDTPPVLHKARAFFEDECGLPGGFQLHTSNDSAHGWRQRARLAVRRDGNGRPVVGLFDKGSHAITAIPSCVVHHPAINQVAELVQQALEACAVEPYIEGNGSGQLRYVQLTVVDQEAAAPPSGGRGTSAAAAPAVQLVLVWNSEAAPEEGDSEGSASLAALSDLASHLWQLGGQPAGAPPLLHSVWANFQPARTNVILGPEWRLLHGTELAWTRLGDADICFGPGSFMQANYAAMDRCLRVMQEHVPPGSVIADLHAGVGTIGLSLAATRQPRSVAAVEINGQGQGSFEHSAARLQHTAALSAALPAGGNDGSTSPPLQLGYHVAAAGSDPGRWCRNATTVVCDPPRKGLEASLLRWLCKAAPEQGPAQLVYLSCSFASLRRDATELLASGRWRLRHAEGFLFVPGTNHIETLAVFERTQGASKA